MRTHSTAPLAPAKARSLDTNAPILDPYSDPRSQVRCASLLLSLQRRGPAERRYALGDHGVTDRYTLDEIAAFRKPDERPSIATLARAAEAYGFSIVLVWRDGEPCLGVDFERKSES